MATSTSSLSVARQNLKSGLSSPIAKIGIAVFVVLIIGSVSLAGFLLRGGNARAGAAKVEGYGRQAAVPRGATDEATASAVGQDADAQAALARDQGQSYAGPFVFAGESIKTGPIADTGRFGKETDEAPKVISALRSRAAEYDQAEQRAGGNRTAAGGGTGLQSQVSQGGFSVDKETFDQIANQLRQVGAIQMRYEALPTGLLARGGTQPVVSAPTPIAPGAAVPARDGAEGAPAPKPVVVVRAGVICPAQPEVSVNTDYAVPVFIKLLDCGQLTGARMRGKVVKAPTDFTLYFTTLFLDPAKKLTLVGGAEAVSVNISKDGEPGVADSVDNHWFSRIASSALLALARTEKQFLSARGSTTITTGSSSNSSIDPLTGEEKRAARVAGVLEGGIEVITKDLGAGVSRQATMVLNKNTVIGVMFMEDVKVSNDLK